MLSEQYGGTNSSSSTTYSSGTIDCTSQTVSGSFSEILLESKFVLSPSGMGYGCYTHWEVLAHGAIPVIDTDPGFDRTFAGLPVVIVADNAD
eukprot:3393-Heterococcus_DN1.PRE.1